MVKLQQLIDAVDGIRNGHGLPALDVTAAEIVSEVEAGLKLGQAVAETIADAKSDKKAKAKE